MRKKLFAATAVALLISLLCGAALAASTDVTVRNAAFYGDGIGYIKLGTIPKYTVVTALGTSNSFEKVRVNGVTGYIKRSALAGDRLEKGRAIAILPKGTLVCQRPTVSGRTLHTGKTRYVVVHGAKNGWALVSELGNARRMGFVRSADLILYK